MESCIKALFDLDAPQEWQLCVNDTLCLCHTIIEDLEAECVTQDVVSMFCEVTIKLGYTIISCCILLSSREREKEQQKKNHRRSNKKFRMCRCRCRRSRPADQIRRHLRQQHQHSGGANRPRASAI